MSSRCNCVIANCLLLFSEAIKVENRYLIQKMSLVLVDWSYFSHRYHAVIKADG